jgi:ABC-type Mn2+/Zn2+ transport system permease subunit
MFNYILTVILTIMISLLLMKVYDIMNNKQYTKKDYLQKGILFSIVSSISIFIFSLVNEKLYSNITKPTVLNGGNLQDFTPSTNTNFSPINNLKFKSTTPTF